MRKPVSRIARLVDVAKAAGVSVATVSRYLGGSLQLPLKTSKRIDGAVRQLNYRPNPHAVHLSKGRADAIGLVVPDIANPFFARLAAEIEEAVDAKGYGLVLCVTLNRAGRELEYLERLRRNYVDGLIFMTNHIGSPGLASAINAARHVVLIDEDVTGTAVAKIFCENEEGGYRATHHLIEAGHRRLAFVGGPEEMLTTKERLSGYRRAISEAGPDIHGAGEFFGDYTRSQGRSATERLLALDGSVTGIFFSSDEALMGGMEVLRSNALRIPEDVSVVTFDDVEPLDLFSPPITAIRQPLTEMGRRSVEAVLVRSKSRREIVERLPVSLIVRASVVPPARKNPIRRRAAARRADLSNAQ